MTDPIVRVAGAVPDVSESDNHDWVLLAVQLSVPPPVLVILTVCAAGLLPPAIPEKVKLFPDTCSAGVGSPPAAGAI